MGLVDLMRVMVKGNEEGLNVKQISQEYQIFEVSEDDFDEIVKTVRRAIIASRAIKNIAMLKDLVTKISEIRPSIEQCEIAEGEDGDGANGENKLFDQLG